MASNSCRLDFSPRRNWADHEQERILARWQAATCAAARIGFIAATAIASCVILAMLGR